MVSPDPSSGRLLPAHHLGPGGDADASVGGTLVLLRHGQSVANAEERFAGWLDVPLTARGEREAIRAAQLMDENGLLPDVVHCSVLTRAKLTADIVLATLDRSRVPIRSTWRLNERHYGALQGQRKSDVRAAVRVVERGSALVYRTLRRNTCVARSPATEFTHS